MNIKEIEQYVAIKNEIKVLEHQISRIESKDKQYVSDVVRGSSSNFPYCKRTFTISGHDTAYDKIGELESRIKKLTRELDEMELLADKISDSEIRQIIRLKHFEGKTWRIVGKEMNYSASGIFEKYMRYFEKSEQNEQIM